MDIKLIILKSVYDTLTAEERRELDTWLAADKHRQQLYAHIKQTLTQRQAVEYLAGIDTEGALQQIHGSQAKPTVLTTWRKYRKQAAVALMAAAAIALLAIVSQRLYTTGDEPASILVYEASDEPGTITLHTADDSNPTGHLFDLSQQHDSARVGNMQVSTQAGELQLVCVGDEPTGSSRLQTVTTPSHRTLHLTLTDGTEVWLNTGSQLTFPSHFYGQQRQVELQGEAYFSVARDEQHPFIVQAGGFATRVLGTSFNIRSYSKSDAHVTLVTGSVQVEAAGRELTLRPGDDAHIRPGAISVAAVDDIDTYTAWQKGYFYFDDVPLSTVAQTLGAWYNVNVRINDRELMSKNVYFVAERDIPLERMVAVLNSLGQGRWQLSQGELLIE